LSRVYELGDGGGGVNVLLFSARRVAVQCSTVLYYKQFRVYRDMASRLSTRIPHHMMTVTGQATAASSALQTPGP